ncbi:hypoxanthine phosphoribosyltransferase [Clostridia bacterium]|nr:hypoxanthine phosphoribosyltransferase [Clostridia bacterium]
MMREDIKQVLFSESQLAARVRELAADINRDYAGRVPLIISILKGSFVFAADLVRCIDIECSIDFIACSSYAKSTETSGAVKIIKDLDTDISGREVIIVEDILDSGVTLNYIINLMGAKNPASIKLCVLLDKPARRRVPVAADYRGFEISDDFVVGYGLDFDEKYRNLPYIGVLRPHVYERPERRRALDGP